MINKLEQARELVRRHRIPKALRKLGEEDIGNYADDDGRLYYFDGFGSELLRTEVTPEVLARSLHYVVKLKLKNITDEASIPLGISKYKGLPHLPDEFPWPDRQYFVAQFNLAELHPADIHDAFPASGMLYTFFDPSGEVTVIHYDGPLDRLRVTPYPGSGEGFRGAKYYLAPFLKRSSVIKFRPRALFYLGGDAYDLSEATMLIPGRLRRAVGDVLGGPVVSRDSDCRIFGRPLYWQGEDEHMDDDRGQDPRLLLFQDEFGEGHIHVWIEAKHARRRKYSKCWLDYSGT